MVRLDLARGCISRRGGHFRESKTVALLRTITSMPSCGYHLYELKPSEVEPVLQYELLDAPCREKEKERRMLSHLPLLQSPTQSPTRRGSKQFELKSERVADCNLRGGPPIRRSPQRMDE